MLVTVFASEMKGETMEAIMWLPMEVDFGFLRSWLFWRKILCSLLIILLPVGVIGCSVAQIQADIQKIITLIPSFSGIVTSILAILAAAGVKSTAAGTAIATAFSDASTIGSDILATIKTYQSNIAAMPATTLSQLDAWIAAFQSELTTIQAQFPQLSTTLVAAINAAIIAGESLLAYLAAVLPAPVAQFALPRSFQALNAAGIRFGAQAAVVIPDQRTYAKAYNARIKAAGYGKYDVHVNWIHAGPFPVWP